MKTKVNTKKTAKKVTKKTTKKTTKKHERMECPEFIDKRLRQVRFNMEDNKVNAVWATYLPNIRYLTNFSGSSAAMLILPDEIHFFTDDRYEEQIKTELFDIPNLHTHITRDPLGYTMDNDLLDNSPKLGIETEYIIHAEAMAIRSKLMTKRKTKMLPIHSLLEKYTQPKSPEELESIKRSCQIAEKTFDKMINDVIKPGITEIDLAVELEYQSRKFGSEGKAFDTIVVTGKRGALVHGQPSNAKIKKNDILLMDFGCKVNGFCSDISRTVCVGKPTKEQKDIYALLHRAMTAAITEVRAGMKGNFLDGIARNIIEEAGYGEYFQHSLGHGLGLECHEKPTISFRLTDQVVPENVVLAIEPGVYLPDKFGMRVEDNVVVTQGKNIKLTNAPEELLCL